jgi:pimeloyl-ACP methyl ester carboxylesterase
MTPLFFGESNKPLFGVHHRPSMAAPGRLPVLLCAPFGQEAIRAHRTYRLLAERLAADGHHVLRFDYSFTGDSWGAEEDATLEQWVDDVHAAHQELLDLSGLDRAVWFGVRVGAAIAALASLRSASTISNLVLFDPVIHGRSYIEACRMSHEAFMADEMGRPVSARQLREAGIEGGSGRGLLGFQLGAAMESSLLQLDLANLPRLGTSMISLVESASKESQPVSSVNWLSLAPRARTLHFDSDFAWNSDAAMNEFLVSPELLRVALESIEC